jgi:hypothetical protein
LPYIEDLTAQEVSGCGIPGIPDLHGSGFVCP